MGMKLSENGLSHIKKYEGLRLEAYRCEGKALTIGYGHTGPDVKEGMKITEAQAQAMLRMDVRKAEICVNERVTKPMKQHEFDALVSLVFNIGSKAFVESALYSFVNSDEYFRYKTAGEFGRWIYADKKPLPGLIKRRAAEALMFIGADVDRAAKEKALSAPTEKGPQTKT